VKPDLERMTRELRENIETFSLVATVVGTNVRQFIVAEGPIRTALTSAFEAGRREGVEAAAKAIEVVGKDKTYAIAIVRHGKPTNELSELLVAFRRDMMAVVRALARAEGGGGA
jgi:hypothetical protein